MKTLIATLAVSVSALIINYTTSLQPTTEPISAPTTLDLAEKWAKTNDVPGVLVRAIIAHESLGNSFSEVAEPNGTISRGLMGINSIHIKPNKIHYSELFNAEINIKIGTKLLSNCYKKAIKTLGVSSSGRDRTRYALGCYNGDKTGKYYEKVMAKIAEQFFS